MKIKKTLVSFLILAIIAISSIGIVNAEERDPGPLSFSTGSIETTIVE